MHRSAILPTHPNLFDVWKHYGAVRRLVYDYSARLDHLFVDDRDSHLPLNTQKETQHLYKLADKLCAFVSQYIG